MEIFWAFLSLFASLGLFFSFIILEIFSNWDISPPFFFGLLSSINSSIISFSLLIFLSAFSNELGFDVFELFSFLFLVLLFLLLVSFSSFNELDFFVDLFPILIN